MNKMEQQIDKTLESLDGIHRAKSNYFMYEKVMQRINNDGLKTLTRQSRIIWQMAALILILISINLLSLVYFSKTSGQSQDNVKSIANEYFSYMDPIKF